MKTKNIILVSALFLSTFAIAFPGEKKRFEECQENRMDALGLSEDQKVEFKEIMAYKKESMQKEMKSIHEESMYELSKVLTTEQMEQIKSQKRGYRLERKQDN